MWFFFRKGKTTRGGKVSRFRSNYFQQRIRNARSFKRSPKILPEARTNVSLASFSRRTQILWGVAIIACLATLWYVAFSGTFVIKHITITGTNTIPEETIKEWLWELGDSSAYYFFPGNHYFAVNSAKVERLLSSKTIHFKRVVRLDKSLPDTLDLTLEERVPAIVWNNGAGSFLLDDEGFVLEKVPNSFALATTTKDAYLVVAEQSTSNIETGNFYESEKVNFLVNMKKRWQDRLEYKINLVQASESPASDVFVTADSGFTAYLDSREDIAYQMETLARILRQIAVSDRISSLAYVDVRLPVIAYYCFLGQPCGSIETETENQSESGDVDP